MASPSAFVSYSWDDDDHKQWVRDLSARLRGDGVEVILDQWHAVPGDQLPEFMERAVRENDYVLIVCTPRYKERSDKRVGGVGYEGDVITGEVMSTRNQRKFIPVLRRGSWHEAAPSWLAGKYYVSLTESPYPEQNYQDLLRTMLGTRPGPPPVARPAAIGSPEPPGQDTAASAAGIEQGPIRVTGIIVDEVGVPRGNGTRGSALYEVPFRLSRMPPPGWADFFVRAWDLPPRFTSAHRPGIASVVGDRIILDGTTVEEIEHYHRETLILAVNQANDEYEKYEHQRRAREEAERKRLEEHESAIKEAAKRIKFDK
jgi:nucleotide-binding universal stress UspA family protein